jgi:hypothetical protein
MMKIYKSDDIASFEAKKLYERNWAGSTYEVIENQARVMPDNAALSFIPNVEQPVRSEPLIFRQLLAQVTQFANLYRRNRSAFWNNCRRKVLRDSFGQRATKAS